MLSIAPKLLLLRSSQHHHFNLLLKISAFNCLMLCKKVTQMTRLIWPLLTPCYIYIPGFYSQLDLERKQKNLRKDGKWKLSQVKITGIKCSFNIIANSWFSKKFYTLGFTEFFLKFIFYTTQFINNKLYLIKSLCLHESVPEDTETCYGITDYETCCKRYF